MSYHQYTSLLRTDTQQTRKLLSILDEGTLTVWHIDKHEAMEEKDVNIHKLTSTIIPGARGAFFLPYAGATLLSVSVDRVQGGGQVQLWELIGFDDAAKENKEDHKDGENEARLVQVKESKAGIHSNILTGSCCCRDVIFSADKHECSNHTLSPCRVCRRVAGFQIR